MVLLTYLLETLCELRTLASCEYLGTSDLEWLGDDASPYVVLEWLGDDTLACVVLEWLGDDAPPCVVVVVDG